mmetsp:Transcript_39243/g.124745  ORF Transcript_39243/g.124745 Transcript_39243/m.124745 type:complete len:209 (-) Transcript_39243:14-640(-)
MFKPAFASLATANLRCDPVGLLVPQAPNSLKELSLALACHCEAVSWLVDMSTAASDVAGLCESCMPGADEDSLAGLACSEGAAGGQPAAASAPPGSSSSFWRSKQTLCSTRCCRCTVRWKLTFDTSNSSRSRAHASSAKLWSSSTCVGDCAQVSSREKYWHLLTELTPSLAALPAPSSAAPTNRGEAGRKALISPCMRQPTHPPCTRH